MTGKRLIPICMKSPTVYAREYWNWQVQLAGTVDEEVKYGGILFAAPEPFCGIFVYKQHVSVEFSHGAKIVDPHGLLEGKGKGRRHLKLHTLEDVENKHLANYLQLAQQAAE